MCVFERSDGGIRSGDPVKGTDKMVCLCFPGHTEISVGRGIEPDTSSNIVGATRYKFWGVAKW